DVVDAAQHPEIAVFVLARGIAREVTSGNARPILLFESLGIAPDVADHARPRLPDDEITFAIFADRFAFAIDDIGDNAGQREGAGAWLQRRGSGHRRNHDRSGFGLPPGVDDGKPAFTNHTVIPVPRGRIDRLADRAEQPQT